MRFGFIADIHLSKYSQDKIEDQSNLPERLHSIKSAIYEVAEYCLANGIKVIVIGGDTLHGKSVIYAIAQEIMLQYFHDFMDLNFIVLDGNHDLSGKGTDVVSALRPLEHIPNVNWVKFSETAYLQNEGILIVPYSTNLTNIIKNNKARILISHFGLSEAILNSGISVVSDVSLSDLRGRYELVLLGHYHKPQEIIQNNIKLYYVGSPIQLDWGEKNDIKRFLIVDTDTLQVDSIPINSYKKHIELELTNQNKDEIFKLAKQIKDCGDHCKIIMKEKVNFDNKVKNEFHIIDKTEIAVTDRGITSSMSQEDKLMRYLEIKQIPDDEKEIYKQIGLEIIRESEETL